jgi:CheY-like chemotaxis protein
MPSFLALSFESVDSASAALAADLVRLIRVHADERIATCDVGIDRMSRYVGVRAELSSDLSEPARRRLAFWTSRVHGRAHVLRSDDRSAQDLDRRLRNCEFYNTQAGLLHVAAAIRAIFRRSEPIEARAAEPTPLDEPVLLICVSGPAAEGLRYDPRRREIFVASSLAPPVGDKCVVQFVALGHVPLAVRARVVEPATWAEADPEAPGFALALGESRDAHDLLIRFLTPNAGTSYPRKRPPRHRVLGPVRIRSVGDDGRPATTPEPAFLRDLSAGGAFVRMEPPHAVGERLELEAILPNGAELRARGTVVHARSEGMGLQFDKPVESGDPLASALSELGARPPRILIVDDDALVREMLSDAFRARGYDVITAADGTFGIHTLTDQLFTLDLLITDVLMSGLDGEALVRTIRKFGGERDLPILVVTGSLGPQLAERMRGLGANAILPKSDGVPAIVAAADALLAQQASTRSALELPIVDDILEPTIAPVLSGSRRCV